LAEYSGYSIEAIYCFERGRMSNGADIPPWVWHRYKTNCAGVDAQLRERRNFTWGQ
jgi:hypothetical protein